MDFGKPIQATISLKDVQGEDGVCKREFEHGLILVNPTKELITHRLNREMYDVSSWSGEGDPAVIEEVTIGPYDAAFLMIVK